MLFKLLATQNTNVKQSLVLDSHPP